MDVQSTFILRGKHFKISAYKGAPKKLVENVYYKKKKVHGPQASLSFNIFFHKLFEKLLYANTASFCRRNLSICGFWYSWWAFLGRGSSCTVPGNQLWWVSSLPALCRSDMPYRRCSCACCRGASLSHTLPECLDLHLANPANSSTCPGSLLGITV